MNADKQTTSEIEATLKSFNEAYTKRNMSGLMSLLAPDPDVTFIGTGADEERVGSAAVKEQIERDWSQSESASMDVGHLSISNAGSVAWVAGDVMVKAKTDGKEMAFPLRVTAVMDKRDGHWLIDQWHFSMPMAGQEKGHSFPS